MQLCELRNWSYIDDTQVYIPLIKVRQSNVPHTLLSNVNQRIKTFFSSAGNVSQETSSRSGELFHSGL